MPNTPVKPMSAVDRAQADSDKKRRGKIRADGSGKKAYSKKAKESPCSAATSDESELAVCKDIIRDRVPTLSHADMTKEYQGKTFIQHLLAYRRDQRAKGKQPRISDKYLGDLVKHFRAAKVKDVISNAGQDRERISNIVFLRWAERCLRKCCFLWFEL